ncbi:MAG TPA: peptidase MA family metallohydrolase [Chloroflexia bacterium]|nr:peptidase MA family metallohydrolase [Chloroflexia bacterium]
MQANINSRIVRWCACFLLLWGIVLCSLPAQTASAQVTSGLPPGVQVALNTAVPNFPDNITFQFKATLTSEIPVLSQVDLAYRVNGEVATNVHRQKLENSSSPEAKYVVDTQKEYIPPGASISYYWRLTDSQGNIYETPHQIFAYQDNRFNFKELKKGLLTVRWYQGDANFGQTALNKAQATVDRLSGLYKVQPDKPINITIYPDSRAMFTALPPNTQEWVGGQAIPELGTIVLAVAPGDLKELGRSIPHEVSHQVVYQATRNPYNVPPKWLDEGLAVNNQDQVDGFLQEAFERGRDKRTLFPLRVLNGSFPADTQQSYLAYGQSVQLVRYILKTYGDSAIEKMLAAFKTGMSYDEVVETGLGISLDQLDWEWKKSISYPVAPPIEATPAGQATLASTPQASEALVVSSVVPATPTPDQASNFAARAVTAAVVTLTAQSNPAATAPGNAESRVVPSPASNSFKNSEANSKAAQVANNSSNEGLSGFIIVVACLVLISTGLLVILARHKKTPRL